MVCQWDRNPEISLSSRNNPEMFQCSSDLPMLVNFSIYIFPWDLLWTGWYCSWGFWAKKLIFHWLPLKSETFKKKSQSSEPIDVPSGCVLGNINVSYFIHKIVSNQTYITCTDQIWSRRKSLISILRTTKIAPVLGDINVSYFIHKTV